MTVFSLSDWLCGESADSGLRREPGVGRLQPRRGLPGASFHRVEVLLRHQVGLLLAHVPKPLGLAGGDLARRARLDQLGAGGGHGGLRLSRLGRVVGVLEGGDDLPAPEGGALAHPEVRDPARQLG